MGGSTAFRLFLCHDYYSPLIVVVFIYLQLQRIRHYIVCTQYPNGVNMSDRQIAAYVGVSHTQVNGVRKELELSGKLCQIETRNVQRGDQNYTQNTAKIGRADVEYHRTACR